jgi:hypothetical protein
MGKKLNVAGGLFLTGLGLVKLFQAFTEEDGSGGVVAGSLGKVTSAKGLPSGAAMRAYEEVAGISGRAMPISKKLEVNGLDEKAKILAKLVRGEEGYTHPVLIQAARQIAGDRSGGTWSTPEKDWEREATAIYKFARKRVHYMRDPVDRDCFSTPLQTLFVGSGDCDDSSVLIAALGMAVGQRARFRVIRQKESPSWDHIYVLLNPEGDGKKWIAMDASVNASAGWEAPGAGAVMALKRKGLSAEDRKRAEKEAAAGIVADVIDFDV